MTKPEFGIETFEHSLVIWASSFVIQPAGCVKETRQASACGNACPAN
jgi:hypothetical protein